MISEEEANAQIERLQQRLTLNLQEIDKNFTDCNQVLTSRIIPEIEKYADSTLRIWNHSKIWLYFFNSLNEINDPTPSIHSEEGTNRPAHDSTLDSAEKWKHEVTMKDITTLSRLRMSLQPPASIGSHDSTTGQDYPHKSPAPNASLIRSVSTDSTTPSSYHQGYRDSPPRSIPFAPSPKSLLGTPVREQAKILTDNVLQTVGIRSSDEEDSNHGFEFESLSSKKRRLDEGWDASSMMETDDIESRNRFNSFLQKRQIRYQNMGEFDEFNMEASPANLSTPTMSRVLHESEQAGLKPESPTFMNMTPFRGSEGEVIGAYEFTGELSQKYNKEMTGTPSSKNTEEHTMVSNMSMMSGSTGQIPARFALSYFPERFRIPPASTQLTRVYHYFADRPGVMITLQDIVRDMKDQDYSKEHVQLLVQVLVRRKYLKRVGDKDAWTIRR